MSDRDSETKSTETKDNHVWIVTYNVLSPTYGKSHVAHDPSDVDPSARYERILEKLKPHIERKSIICLQEIGQSWTGPIISYFQQKNYVTIYSLYGEKKSDYFGVLIAIPNDTFELVDASIIRPADTKKWPFYDVSLRRKWWLRTNVVEPFQKMGFVLQCLLAGVLIAFWFVCIPIVLVWMLWKLFDSGKYPSLPPWVIAKDRNNTMVMARVRFKNAPSASSPFVIATYHMPCAFYSPPMMIMHSALSMQAVQKYARGQPFIFCGDFNSRPVDESYDLYTEGFVSQEYQNLIPNDNWSPNLPKRVQSAYQKYLGKEPLFTNHSCSPPPVFSETLDYIFTSLDCQILDVIDLPKKPLPTTIPSMALNEPSDHILIGALIKIPKYLEYKSYLDDVK